MTYISGKVMAPMTVLTSPHPALVAVCTPVKFINKAITTLTDRMLEVMRDRATMGLAAPQVGKRLRLVVLNVGTGDLVYINPRVTHVAGYTVSEEECLSLPGVQVSLTRSEIIHVRAFDLETGKAFAQVVSGKHAIVLQHAVDHLDGLLIVP